MANPTSNFGWQMPTSTDLVTDLPADFETFGQAVDTSMADLKGGTTGQILSKATNTDMDFVWITNDVGDITAVNVTSPITGGGTSGAVTIGVDAATTLAAGVVQLTDSTSSTSTTTAATPNSVKSAYDLANAAIAKSLVDAKGDIIAATADNTVSRLAVGTNGQVLTADSTAATGLKWASPSSTFVGCVAYTAASSFTTTGGTPVIFGWNAEIIDTNGFHDNTTNNSRLTIPTGYGGKYLVTVQFELNTATGMYFISYIKKNGSPSNGVNRGSCGSSDTNYGFRNFYYAEVISLAAGDYVEYQLQTGSSGTWTNTYGQFSCVYLGA